MRWKIYSLVSEIFLMQLGIFLVQFGRFSRAVWGFAQFGLEKCLAQFGKLPRMYREEAYACSSPVL